MEGSADAAPAAVGRYALIEPIGRGASATVWRARDPKLGRDIAVKLVERWDGLGGSRGEAVARVVREAQAVAALNHPNIVPIFDVGRFDTVSGGEGVFLAMEYLQGRSLRAWLRETSPSQESVMAAFDQAAQALHAAHVAGVVHRDFKPSNAMMGSDDRVRVIDFGLARAIGAPASLQTQPPEETDGPVIITDLHASLTTTGTVMGTPAYMSPEQHRGLPVGPQSDQFSFCVALFEALTGRRPHAGKDLRILAQHKQQEALEGVEDLPPRLQPIVRRGLSADPHARWPDMDALRTALRPRNRSARRRSGLLAAGLVGVAAVTAAVWPRTDPSPAVPPEPDTEAIAPADPTVHAGVARLRLLRETGEFSAALALGETQLAQLSNGPNVALRAAVSAEHAVILEWNGAPTRAAELREQAFHEAMSADAHAVAFELAVALALHAFERRPAEAHSWIGQAEAALERGALGPAAQASLLGLRAQEAQDAYHLDVAERLLDEALPLLEGLDRIDTEERLLAQAAQVAARKGRFEEHLDLSLRAADRVAAEYGPNHPRVALALARLSGPAVFLGRDALSKMAATAALRLAQSALEPDHVVLGDVRAARALAVAEWGEVEAAQRDYDAAQRAFESMDSPVDRDLRLADLWSTRGLAFHSLGRSEEAIRFLQKARDTHVRLLGSQSLSALTDGNNLAMAFRDMDRLEDAEREALAVAEAFEGSPADPSMRAFTYDQLAKMMLASERPQQALAWAERAVETWEAVGDDRPEGAFSCFLAARAALPIDRIAAEAYARKALDRVDDEQGSATILAWLRTHGFEEAGG